MNKSTFIKLNRNILNWRWYKNSNTFRLFVHLLLTANIKENNFEMVTIHRGELATSIDKLAKALELTPQQIKTAISHLKLTGEITSRSTSKFTIISIKNYDVYQAINKQINNQSTNEQQTNNKRITNEQQQSKNVKNVKNVNNVKNGKNEREGTLAPLGRFKNVFLTQNEIDELRTKFPNDYEAKIERMSRYLESTGKTYRNQFSTLLEWLEQDVRKSDNDKKREYTASYDIDELEKIETLDDS